MVSNAAAVIGKTPSVADKDRKDGKREAGCYERLWPQLFDWVSVNCRIDHKAKMFWNWSAPAHPISNESYGFSIMFTTKGARILAVHRSGHDYESRAYIGMATTTTSLELLLATYISLHIDGRQTK